METQSPQTKAAGTCLACIVFAPSHKSPAYEQQVRLLQEDAAYFRQSGVRLLKVLASGQSVDGEVGLTHAEAEFLRVLCGVHSEQFAVVLHDAQGNEIGRYSAPLRIETIRECYEVSKG